MALAEGVAARGENTTVQALALFVAALLHRRASPVLAFRFEVGWVQRGDEFLRLVARVVAVVDVLHTYAGWDVGS